MSTSKHIYGDGEYRRVVILNHGSSETQVLYDSDDKQAKGRSRRIKKSPAVILDIEDSWLPTALQRAKEAGDLND